MLAKYIENTASFIAKCINLAASLTQLNTKTNVDHLEKNDKKWQIPTSYKPIRWIGWSKKQLKLA